MLLCSFVFFFKPYSTKENQDVHLYFDEHSSLNVLAITFVDFNVHISTRRTSWSWYDNKYMEPVYLRPYRIFFKYRY